MNQCDTTHNRQQQTRRRTQAAKSVGPIVLLLTFHGFSLAFSTLFDFGGFFDKITSLPTNHERVNGANL